MSQGERFPREYMHDAARVLLKRWGLEQARDLMIGGSIRRLKHYAGDIDLTMPLPAAGERDELYHVLDAQLGPPPSPSAGLFAGVAPPGKQGWVLKGLRPGFHACELVAAVDGYVGQGARGGPLATYWCPVQIHRWTAENRGWIELLRTGPLEFTRQFLVRWKRIHEMRSEQQASREGFLRDHDDAPVATPTELECFTRCRMRYVKPEDRQTFHWKVPD